MSLEPITVDPSCKLFVKDPLGEVKRDPLNVKLD
jgi:hypothetical protein